VKEEDMIPFINLDEEEQEEEHPSVHELAGSEQSRVNQDVLSFNGVVEQEVESSSVGKSLNSFITIGVFYDLRIYSPL